MTTPSSVLDRYPTYEAVIGIEVHVQLTTASKIFCSCANQPGQKPNTNICHICTGHPGVLPRFNKQVIDYALRAGLATNCSITTISEFDRKHYFYPDLPKGYQITQSYKPICTEGFLPIICEDGSTKKIRINRIHIEEDAGKNIHASAQESLVDLNRAGTPLLEIVTEPDISSSHQAKAYLKGLHGIVTYAGICTGNMEEGSFRADTNISVRKKGSQVLGTKCELKNINSFKFIGDAVEYEIERHIHLIESGGSIRQETRLWDSKEKKTYTMRVKEESADYRYFPDPDLPLIIVDDAWIARVAQEMPELPHQKTERFINEYGLSAYEADIFIEQPDLATYYEKARALTTHHKALVNWILRDLIGYLNEQKQTPATSPITPEKLVQLIDLLESGIINNHAAKEVFLAIAQTGLDPALIVKQRGLEQIGSEQELETIIKDLIAQHPQEAADYKAGREKLFGFFVGLAMKQTQGKGNPKIIQSLLKKHLS